MRRWQDQLERAQVLEAHLVDQLMAARQELYSIGYLALQEADSPPVQALEERISRLERRLNEVHWHQFEALQRLNEYGLDDDSSQGL